MQTVLVSGGAGFIGSHLCAYLLSQNYQVICIDNLLTGSKINIQPYLNNEQFKFIEFDVINSLQDIKKQFSKLDYIFHLASPASPNINSPRSYLSYPLETLMVNSVGTQNLLELARENNCRFLYASSSEVYGDPTISPQNESYFGNVNPNGIRSVYDEGKRYGEAISMAYVRKFNLDARIVRVFNTYGPNMLKDDGRVVSNFINQALLEAPITVYGKGLQTRSFSYISDTIDGFVKTMFLDNLKGEVFNIGNPIEKTIYEFATIIKELTHSSSEIVYKPLPEDDPKQRKPDIQKAGQMLGFFPKVSLEEGLKYTIDYFKSINS